MSRVVSSRRSVITV